MTDARSGRNRPKPGKKSRDPETARRTYSAAITVVVTSLTDVGLSTRVTVFPFGVSARDVYEARDIATGALSRLRVLRGEDYPFGEWRVDVNSTPDVAIVNPECIRVRERK